MRNKSVRFWLHGAAKLSAVALSVSFLLVTLDMQSASARRRHSNDDEDRSERRTIEKKKPEPAPTGPLLLVVSLAKQTVSVYGNDGLVTKAPVSTGRPGHSTPSGLFNILEKEYFHRSNIYSGAPMPFMQRITWSGVALHAGVLPGYPASHGCIRMPAEFAKRLYGMTQGKENVVVTRQEIAPADISSVRLPAPLFQPNPIPNNIASGSNQVLQNALSITIKEGAASGPLKTALEPAKNYEQPQNEAAGGLLNPIEFASIMKAQAARRIEAANAAMKTARVQISGKNREAEAAAVELRRANVQLQNAKDRLESLNKKAQKDDAATNEALKAEMATAEAAVKDAQSRLDAAQQAQQEKARLAADAVRAYEDAERESKLATMDVKNWTRRLNPVSVFISRKTSRLYVRQGFTRLFDVPVTVKDAEKPIGTHLFVAMQPQWQNGGNQALRWVALSVPSSLRGADASDDGERRRSRRREAERSINEGDGVPSASEALERIEIPAEIERKISELVWTGASLIVSDNTLGDETGDATGFIILTR